MVWATEKFPLAKLTYNTYTESDYNVIWGNYTYAGGGAEGWPGLDFGKRKCSAAKPQHASYTATAVEHSVEVVSDSNPVGMETIVAPLKCK